MLLHMKIANFPKSDVVPQNEGHIPDFTSHWYEIARHRYI